MSKIKKKQMDMIHGPMFYKILFFALPLAASSILQQLFNSADVAVVGRFAGSAALAAVGGNSPVINLLINMFVGLSIGANVIIANFIGQGREDKVKEAVHTVMSVALISGVSLLLIGIIIAKPILLMINTPSEVINLAVLYLRIYFLGMPFVMVYNFGAAILRSTGETRKPLYCLIISGIINILLNLLLVIVFHLSVAGVAIATVIADGVSAFLVVYFLSHSDDAIRLNIRELSLNKEIVVKVIKIGAPAGLQGVVFSLSNVFIQSAINGFGTHAMAGSSAGLNYEYFTYYMINAFNQTAVTFTSQNYGAKDLERCKRAFRISLVTGMALTLVMSFIFVGATDFFAGIYTNDPVAIKYAIIRMKHVTLLECLTGVYEISGGALRGMGHSLLPALLTVIGSCGFRVVWLYTVFKVVPTFTMLMNVYPVTWVITGTMVMTSYLIIRKRKEAGQ
ncbi:MULTISPECIES: MATE family efflux transporter [unclassified Eubacterium (in: firmicutes)]|uniref:MATE family efflux transporter n=1 Tax=unclassified Eubacterium (in: firmicutes) TaxID=2624479 RepID=UPI0018F55475|nr:MULTISPECIES: MATE family efflux transporter [unclassified Eubacterium (in: firmicutes)]